ncbi:FabD/lysophospholipase-like protein [Martensiomyces pterosporus]|nr:FabD/lysophospholipase-like protein [Martensiomyces pterosporus]
MLPDQLRRPWLSACAGLYLDRDIYPEIGKPAECRLGSSICSEEAEFRQKRAERVRKDFAEFIGVPEAAIDSRDVPVIAVAGSGGGFRAMVSSIGSLRAMYSAGLLQCVMYNAAVSGSSWAFAALHTYANGNPYAVLDNVRQAMQSSMFNTSSLVSFVTNNDNVAKRLLAAAKNTLLSMSVPPLSIVELYGALLFKQLLVQRTADADGNPKLSLDPQWMKLSSQRNGVDSGDLPMPIYTAVRHFIGSTDNQAKDAAAEGSHHRYQWFEFSPYEVGSIEHGAWVPTWGLGRPMENGKDLLRVGEIHFGSIMGTVASAFCASVKAMVMEIYLACPGPVRAAMDPLLDRLDYDTSVAHPIPPYTLFNPFYRTDERRSGPHELVELESQPFLSLMDAGLENNLPFAPLLRPARGVDIIICLDSSANIEAMPWFARAESWAKEHNVQRWPWGARPWKADPLRPSRAELELASGPGKAAVKDAASRTEDSMLASNARCAIFDKPLAPSPFQPSLEPPITIVYLPLLPNKQFRDPDFDPAEAGFCATFNDQWTSEQVDKLADLTSLNFTQELDSIRKAMRRAYERKRAWREYLEKHQHQQ